MGSEGGKGGEDTGTQEQAQAQTQIHKRRHRHRYTDADTDTGTGTDPGEHSIVAAIQRSKTEIVTGFSHERARGVDECTQQGEVACVLCLGLGFRP